MHLPRYLAVSPPDTHNNSIRVDPEILGNMIRLGFNEAEVVESVTYRKADRAFVAYSLMLDNSHRISSGYLGKELCEGMDDVELMQPESLIKSDSTSSEYSRSAKIANQRVAITERRWTLGIHYRASPAQLMSELLKVLRSHDIIWKRGRHESALTSLKTDCAVNHNHRQAGYGFKIEHRKTKHPPSHLLS